MPKPKKDTASQNTAQGDPDIERIGGELEPIMAKLGDVMAITDADAEARASEFLLQIQRRYKLIEEKRKSYVAPFKQQIKVIEADFNRYLDPLEQAIASVRQAMSAWRNSATFKAAEAKRLEIEAEAREAIRAGDAVAVASMVNAHGEASVAAPRAVRVDSGSVHFREDTKFEIIDASLIPRQYLVPDEKTIRAAVKAGAIIPGVRTWVESVPVGRS